MTSYLVLQERLRNAQQCLTRGKGAKPAPPPPAPSAQQSRWMGPGRRARARPFSVGPVSFRIPGMVPPIRQPKSADCWATVTTMMVAWKEDWRESRLDPIRPVISRYGQKYLDLYDNNRGLPLSDWPEFMVLVGLVAQPGMSRTPEGWAQLLRSYGPIFVWSEGGGPNDGWSHGRIIVGIEGDGTPDGTRMQIVDPATGTEYAETLTRFAQLYEAQDPLAWEAQVVHWPPGSRVSLGQSWRSTEAWRGAEPRRVPGRRSTFTFETPQMAWGAKVSAGFRDKVRILAGKLGVDPSDLMAVIAFETGESFSPAIRNKRSGATGLIQFMPSTAKGLGTTTDALAAMAAEDQLDYVERYFAQFGKTYSNLEDLYMAVLYPKAIGKPNADPIFIKGDAGTGRAYDLNKELDKDGDGKVSKAEAAAFVKSKREKGLKDGIRG